MKVLVVDDQLHVYKAIQLKVQGEKYGITDYYYAANGEEALEIMRQEFPELVFTDMQMPKMDGPQFLMELREQGYTCEVIAVSGFRDFEYMKALIGADGVEYLTKPLEEQELNEAVRKAVERIWEKREKQKNEQEAKRFREEMCCRRIGAWLDGSENFNEEIENSLKTIGIDRGNYRMALLLFHNPDKIIADMYDEDVNQFQQELLLIAKDIFVKSTACYLIPVSRFLYFFMMQTPNEDEEGYNERLERLTRVIHNIMSTDSIYSYSKRIGEVKQLPAITDELKAKILTKTFCYSGGTLRVEDAGGQRNAIDYHEGRISGLTFLLRQAVRDKDLETVGNILSEFTNGLRAKRKYGFYELQIYTSEFNLLQRKILAESREAAYFQIKQISPWIYDLNVWENKVKEAFMSMTSCQFDVSLNITAVHAYLIENYNQDLSIAKLSERFCQCPQHLSKQYKNKYQETIGQTIKRERMEKAKDYLRHSKMTIREIADRIGYEDDNYFGKVFKKYCGMSPQQYRKEQAV